MAGAHSDWTVSFEIENTAGHTHNDAKDVTVEVPAGFMGSTTAVPTCTFGQLLTPGEGTNENACPPASQVGVVTFDASIGGSTPERYTAPVYNMETTSFGVTAEFGIKTIAITTVLLVNVRPGDSGITVTTRDIERIGEIHKVSVTTWGLPGAESHNAERGLECIALATAPPGSGCKSGGERVTGAIKPFLANPTSCEQSFTAKIEADSWEQPGKFTPPLGSEVARMEECDRVPFDASIEAEPTVHTPESPSGLEVSLLVPQRWSEPLSVASSNVQSVRVTLPKGYTLNPSEGNGLAGCTPQQYAAETAFSLPGQGCPSASKIGTVKIETPVLAEAVEGSVYVAQPYDNPFSEPGHPNGSLLALYVVAKAPDRGVIVKTAGRVELDPVTGQVTSTFANLPQQPFGRVTFKLIPGVTAPLVSPPVCGAYSAQAALTPWSAPGEPREVTSPPFSISGSACPTGGAPPFKPRVISGEQNNDAGSYSPFYLRLVREDGEQEITRFTTILPPGLTGNLSGIPFCPDAAVEAARRATGQQELGAPSCPAASEIGHTLVGAGVGGVLAWTPGKIYLAGPYHGAPLSIVSVTSATVGPFDLGTVVIRFALRINPLTAQVEVDSSGSDPIPHILPPGIVVHVRDIHVYVDRGGFIENPTSCAPMTIADTITGIDPSNPSSQVPVTVSTPYQAADCANLGFKPSFKVSTSSSTSRTNGASLSVKLAYPKAPQGSQANIRSVKVDLPKQLPSRLTTLQKACLDSTFAANPAACPAASRVGQATAITPILPVPLAGPAYFVSHGGAKFPELIVVLQGYGITIDLHGETFISKHGITSSTFRSVPDQPVTSFELTLPQGRYSALAANGNLCKAKLRMPTAFTAQNGHTIHQSTSIAVTGCKHHRRARAKAKH